MRIIVSIATILGIGLFGCSSSDKSEPAKASAVSTTVSTEDDPGPYRPGLGQSHKVEH